MAGKKSLKRVHLACSIPPIIPINIHWIIDVNVVNCLHEMWFYAPRTILMVWIFFFCPSNRLEKFWIHWACTSIVVHWHVTCLVARRSVFQLLSNSWTIHRYVSILEYCCNEMGNNKTESCLRLCSSMNQHRVLTVQHVSNASVYWSFWLAAVEQSSVCNSTCGFILVIIVLWL